MSDGAEAVSILLVDDRAEKLGVLSAALESPDLRLVTAGSGTDALRLLLTSDVAVILLDVDMPGMDGYETARLIRGRERNRHTPIIFITAYASDETPVAKGYALGAVDYLFAPVSPEVLRAKVAAFVELHRLRAEAQQRAESSESRLAALAEAVPQLVWSTDEAGRMVFANRRWLEYTGIPFERSQQAGWSDVIHPDDGAAVAEAWRRAIADGEAFEVEFRLRRGGDGAWRWFLSRGVPRHDRSGRVDGWIGTSTDVHEVRETERRLRWLLDNTTETIWRFDSDGAMPVDLPEDAQLDAFYAHAFLGECNASMARAYGFASADAMKGLRLGQLMPREDPANEAMLRAFIRGGYRLIDAESNEVAKDGSQRCFLNNLIGEIEAGRLVRAWGTSRDVTDRRRADERTRVLGDASAALASAFDAEAALPALASLIVPSFADGCLIELADADGVLRRVLARHVDPDRERLANEMILRHGGPARRAAAGGMSRRRIDGVGPADEDDQRRLLHALDSGQALVVPMVARGRPVGVLTVLQSSGRGRAFADGDAAFAEELARRAAVALDNARLYQDVERQRALAAQRADQLAASNAELQQFAYVSSHDLQEPLRMVTQYMGLLQRRYADRLDERGRSFVAYAAEGAARMHRLIDDLLAYARTGRAEQAHATVDPATLVAEVLENLRAQAQDADARIEVGELPAVRGDRTRLALVFQNLVGNALKFRAGPARVRISGQAVGPLVEFSVSDDGIGIEPQYQARIFEVFQRLHSRERYPGTGIGLAICKKIVEQHGGRIWVESEPGRGSTFRFTVQSADGSSITGPHPALR